LRQSYENWEYLLVDNCSTDGSGEIAQEYASRYPGKIRLMHTGSFLTQVQNYNFAISHIAPDSKYCKMVQADDWICPECLKSMVAVAEAHPAVGIVGAYELEGDDVRLDGLPYSSTRASGRDACRLYFLRNKYLFGTPTSVLVRSDIVRERNPFYEERYAPFEDAHVCFDLLRASDFGFVHQVLTYSRRESESIISEAREFGLLQFLPLALLVAHGRDYLSVEEYNRCLRRAERNYYLCLSKCALRGRSPKFWQAHREGMASIRRHLEWWSFAKVIPRALLEKAWDGFWAHWDGNS